MENGHRDGIFKALRKDGRFRLDNCFQSTAIRAGGKPIHPAGVTYCTRGHFDHTERDDDTDCTVLGVHCLKPHGPEFATANIAHQWQMRLPCLMTCTDKWASAR